MEKISAGTDPESFDISPDGKRLFVSNEDANTASVIDLETRQIVATVPVGIEPEGVTVRPDGKLVYVTGETSHTVSVIAADALVVATILVGSRQREGLQPRRQRPS